MAAGTWQIEDMYINNRDYPGGPLAFFLDTVNLPEFIMLLAILLVQTFLSDLLVLWRCWVIWNASGRLIAYAVIAFPVMLLVASIPSGIIWVMQSGLSSSYTSALLVSSGITYYVTSLGVNIIVTVLIIIRLLRHRRLHLINNLPAEHSRPYLSVASILIESAALYSVFVLAYVVSFALDSPIKQIFLIASSASQQIAGYLIILRVAQGRAWNSTTLVKTEAHITTLRFQQSAVSGQDDMNGRLTGIESQGDQFANDLPASRPRHEPSRTQENYFEKI